MTDRFNAATDRLNAPSTAVARIIDQYCFVICTLTEVGVGVGLGVEGGLHVVKTQHGIGVLPRSFTAASHEGVGTSITETAASPGSH